MNIKTTKNFSSMFILIFCMLITTVATTINAKEKTTYELEKNQASSTTEVEKNVIINNQ